MNLMVCQSGHITQVLELIPPFPQHVLGMLLGKRTSGPCLPQLPLVSSLPHLPCPFLLSPELGKLWSSPGLPNRSHTASATPDQNATHTHRLIMDILGSRGRLTQAFWVVSALLGPKYVLFIRMVCFGLPSPPN